MRAAKEHLTVEPRCVEPPAGASPACKSTWVDYDLQRLGEREFEHLTQALFQRFVEAGSTVFGDGPDGGREATWDGSVGPKSRLPSDWNGFGVLQSKYRRRPSQVPKENADWLISHLKKDIDGWVKPDSKRERQPEYLLAATNLVLSPADGGGLETVRKEVASYAKSKGLPLRGFDVWHYDSIRVLLDDALDIRRSYAAWITPGDVLSTLFEYVNGKQSELADAMSSYAAKSLIDDTVMNLTQAGAVGDAPVRLDQVFIDLPVLRTNSVHGRNRGIASDLLESGNRKSSFASATPAHRLVLVGGPGQGKSTVGQFLCQLYRANFLSGNALSRDPDIKDASDRLIRRAEKLELPAVRGRRWPVRVVLTDLADSLAADENLTVLGYVADLVARRSGFTFDVSDARVALREYPWFLVLDGLDEVPRSGNRDQVLQSVRDFFLDASSVDADVMVLATTRPQGYNDDFDPRAFAHRELRPLYRTEALEYASDLTAVRLGDGSERCRKVLARLRNAAADDSTSRLMSSPLQVTIMALLIERQGKAPRDRWRLFSQYYRVIYQREQEKGGPLSELLADYEADINAIHFRAGYELQVKSERAGDADSVLTSQAFKELVSEYLHEQGHSTSATKQLADRFEEVATERLVFLTALRDGVVGFEVRSLQEFMAGEYLIDLPEAEVPAALRSVALSAYWRNALLFAIGKVFAERPALKAEAVNLCNLVNAESEAQQAVLLGSRLALQIVLEGATHNQPRYRDSLAHCATQLISAAITRDVVGLADLDHGNSGSQLRASLRKAHGQGLQAQVNAARIYAALVERGDASVIELEEFVEKCSDDAARCLTEFALLDNDWTLLRAVASRGIGMPVSRLLWALSHDDRAFRAAPSELPSDEMGAPWAALVAVRDLWRGTPPDESEDIGVQLSVEPELTIHVRPVDDAHILWNFVALVENATGKDWGVLKDFAKFHLTPSPESLATALEALAMSDDAGLLLLADAAAWPLFVCVSSSKSVMTATPRAEAWQQVSARLVKLAAAARRGDLGTSADWIEAERRWRGLSVAEARDELSFVWDDLPGAEVGTGRPIDPSIASRGLLARTRSFSVMHSEQLGGIQYVAELGEILRALPESDHREGLADLLNFALGAELNQGYRVASGENESEWHRSFPPIDLELLILLTHEASKGWSRGRGWFSGIPTSALQDEEVIEILEWSGRQPWASTGRFEIAAPLALRWQKSAEAWPLGRIALFGGSVPVPPEDMAAAADQPLEARLRAACQLLSGRAAGDAGSLISMVELLRETDTLDEVDAWYVLQHEALLRDIESWDDSRILVASTVIESFGSAEPLLCGHLADRLLAALEGLPSGVELA